MSFVVTKPKVEVNNNVVPVKANTVMITEGYGETTVTAASLGGDDYEVEVSDSAEDKVGSFNFSMSPTVANKKSARGWKRNPGVNVVKISGKDPQGNKFTNVYRQSSITNNYEVVLQNGGDIALEWKGAQPIVG